LRKEFQGRGKEFRAKINEKKVEEDEDENIYITTCSSG
jgi:hypothetical protein